jgi:hypothetical protein
MLKYKQKYAKLENDSETRFLFPFMHTPNIKAIL